jgi:hypothetical protein
MLSARGPQQRTIETLVGAIRLRRPYFHCEHCQFGITPLDEALQLTEPRKPPEVQREEEFTRLLLYSEAVIHLPPVSSSISSRLTYA